MDRQIMTVIVYYEDMWVIKVMSDEELGDIPV
jgi:hypothetical protein